MSKNNSHGRRSSVKKDGVLKSSKENIDTYYSIQNENEILKLKYVCNYIGTLNYNKK